MGPYIVCVFFWFILFLTFTKWQGFILRINCSDIEDITCPRGDTNFIFECSTRYLTSDCRERVRYWVEHKKIKFVSTSGHVIFCLLYKHTKDDVFDDFRRFPITFRRFFKIVPKARRTLLNWGLAVITFVNLSTRCFTVIQVTTRYCGYKVHKSYTSIRVLLKITVRKWSKFHLSFFILTRTYMVQWVSCKCENKTHSFVPDSSLLLYWWKSQNADTRNRGLTKTDNSETKLLFCVLN